MFIEFFKLELRSAFKSPMIYIFFALVALFSGLGVATDNVIIGGAVGNVYKNSPHTLTNYVLILGIFGLLFPAAFFNNAALRDHNNQFNEIMFSLPIKKSGYFWGRFLGALVLSTIPMLGVFFGAWIGAMLGPVAGGVVPVAPDPPAAAHARIWPPRWPAAAASGSASLPARMPVWQPLTLSWRA